MAESKDLKMNLYIQIPTGTYRKLIDIQYIRRLASKTQVIQGLIEEKHKQLNIDNEKK